MVVEHFVSNSLFVVSLSPPFRVSHTIKVNRTRKKPWKGKNPSVGGLLWLRSVLSKRSRLRQDKVSTSFEQSSYTIYVYNNSWIPKLSLRLKYKRLKDSFTKWTMIKSSYWQKWKVKLFGKTHQSLQFIGDFHYLYCGKGLDLRVLKLIHLLYLQFELNVYNYLIYLIYFYESIRSHCFHLWV